jgi:ferredoxin
MNIFFLHHHRETRYIRLLRRQCQGCWECVAVCPEDVLVKKGRIHRGHVHIQHAGACNGCKKCVRACAHQAIEYIYIPRSRQNGPEDAVDN